MWFTGVEVEQETSAPPPKKNPGSVHEPKCSNPSFKPAITTFLILKTKK